MEKFYEPTSYYAFHPVYSGAKHYMVFVSHYSMENGEMQICTYSEKKYSIDSCIQWAYLKLALFEKTNAFHMVVFDPSGKETASYSKKEALLEDLWRCFQSVPLTKSEKTVSDWYIFPKETDLGPIRKWFNKRYAGGIVKLSLISLLQETGKDL